MKNQIIYLISWQNWIIGVLLTKIHAVGDYAIHTALNAIEKTREKMDLVALITK